ncbi:MULTISPECIES: hypothetical protein [Dietzia]|uniref:Uncharacterized protein n=1 Tax=Dietzia cinnamea TaxID=321318 RepID=A0A4R3ZSF1_9ACTN|nr:MULTISPECIES: hypothetical protein [Dietzia]AVM63464.1 hypothetical protein C3V38_02640 [Dietzia sp. oral taxon 368]MCT1639928.1 hypothetical protein [Dietzia cinnamea]MCT1885063.1 hypothetical protein [Dietzia cinnamea]MCT2060551.1 hypothetical protein [Dietzia cinnamea]MCT2098938.1 hypothetical protein [Dietzia cinnamea]
MSRPTSVSPTRPTPRSGPIRREPAPGDRDPVPTRPPTSRPWQLWLVLGLSAALVTLLVLRGVVQATAINRFLSDSWPAVDEAAGLAASSAGWIIDTSFVVATAWATIAVYAFSGSRAGRAIFTALLAGSTVIGLWSAVAPQAAALGSGELILAAAHPTFMSLTSLAVALVAIAILALLYRPDVNDYFRADSPATTGQRDRDFLEPALSQTGTEAPLTMSNPAQHRATGPTERTDTTATQSTALPSTTPSREEPIAPAI